MNPDPYEIFSAAYLYMQFTSIRRSLHLSMSGCRMLIRRCNLTDCISLNELDTLYMKIQRNWEGYETTGSLKPNLIFLFD